MKRIVKNPLERRFDIVYSAHRLINAKGYERMSLQDVMTDLNIAKGTIYHYFKSKEELLEAVVDHIVDQLVEKMQAIIEKSKGNALEKLARLVKEGKSLHEPHILDELHKKGNEAFHLRLFTSTLRKQTPVYTLLIEQGCEEKIFHTNHPKECAEFLLTGVQFLTDVGISPWTKGELKRRIGAFPEIIEQMLGAAPGSFKFLKKSWK